MTNRFSSFLFAGLLLLCACFTHAQVSVAIAPDPHPQFLDGDGHLLSGGFLFTYAAGTTTLLNTYVDSAGIIQNPDPIPLDATGAPSNGATETGIWLANAAYKFCAYNSAFVQQWCSDNLTGYLGLLNDANLWTLQQTFSLPIIDTATDNQLVLGVAGNQTTLDFPPPTGNVTLHFPNTADTLVGRATADALSNKTFSDYPTLAGFNPVLTLGFNQTTVTQTGDTSLHTIYTVPIPANALKAGRGLRITLAALSNSAAGGPVVTVAFGGTRISPAGTTTAGNSSITGTIVGGNLGATNSQSWDYVSGPAANTFWGTSNFGHVTSAVDSTVNQNLTVTFQGGLNADSITFYKLLVELL